MLLFLLPTMIKIAKMKMEMITDISTKMVTFPITTNMLRMEVSRGRAQMKENIPCLLGDWIDGYWM